MGSVHEVIEALRQEPSNSERGTKFEQLMVRFLELDPTQNQQYDKVWRWIDWPDRDGKPDTGIDLVARARDTGELTAIQCKFYEPTHTLTKKDIDSFFTASGKKEFADRIIISTTDRWSQHAEDALDGQSLQVRRIGMAEIADSPINWDVAWPAGELRVTLSPAKKHGPREHQREAIDAVFAGFETGVDRGKLVMACGTGKTFTALKIAERTATENGGGARILFAVPSISLLSQTLREWTAQAELPLRAFAVCSDSKVSRAAEDIAVHDVAIPVTTTPQTLATAMSHGKRAKGLTVVFTTYQSLPVVAQAQDLGVDPFDLVICDEAHRTTGVTLDGADESHFVRVHDADYLRARRRLYMTATPRLFAQAAKDQAEEHSAVLVSMDNESLYGPEFHRLSFGKAVAAGLLTDYKVIVLTVDEQLVASPLQQQLAGQFAELRLDDASKIVGCWNALAKRAGSSPDGAGFGANEAPMRRAVVFAKDIAASRQVAEVFPNVVDAYRELLADSEADGHAVNTTNLDLHCEVHHVDGTFNALRRNAELQWLKAPFPEGECRILSNARCLSEGVDVPDLDAVMFLNPRNSQVDVVQSVGRVMRRAEGKNYGYIILPVAVPSGVSPAQALSDNRRFRVVWDVLNALRSHDERFNAEINSIGLNSGADTATGIGTDHLLGGHIGPTSDDLPAGDQPADPDPAASGADSDTALVTQMALFSLSEWQEAIVAKVVDKVGTRTYWESWANDVADIATTLVTRIRVLLDGTDDATVTESFDQFLAGLRDNLNDSITAADAISMLAQHLITKPVFDALFTDHDFAAHNPVSKVMQGMVDTLGGAGLGAETQKLQPFYDSVRVRAGDVQTADGKQKVIAELYEKFFRIGFTKQAEALGIVYTPTEVVDFILRAADAALRDTFGRGLTDTNVHVLDPFTGTGTFLARLLQSGLIHRDDLVRKYTGELHANEIMLLAYYIAAVNIEATYHALLDPAQSTGYEPFPGIVLADTFQISEAGDSMDALMFPQNNDRIVAQLDTKINVVVGNPPYSVGQTSANDFNANRPYPTLDARIAQTYAARSTATNKNSLYDSYLRAFRWATDRIGDAGIVAFVSNGGWIDGNTADGIRLSLAQDYSRIYVYNLRGNQRTAGEQSRREGGKIFGSGSRNTVAVFLGIKDPDHTGPCEIRYRDIGDYLSREEKLSIVADDSLDTVDWQTIAPNTHGDWINQRSGDFQNWPVLGDKKPTPGSVQVFRAYSSGLKTERDSWCYNSSVRELTANVRAMIDTYESIRPIFQQFLADNDIRKPTDKTVDTFLAANPDFTRPDRISWNSNAKKDLAANRPYRFHPDRVLTGQYRPFYRQAVYFHRDMNARLYQLPTMFPTKDHRNLGFYVVGAGSDKPFSALMTERLPDLSFWGSGSGQYFPRWTYTKPEPPEGELDFGATTSDDLDEHGYQRVDNITDTILATYRAAIGDKVTKDDIFYYVYGVLHDPAYRTTYAADLKKMLPHIPTPTTHARFTQLATAGRALAALHIDYESVTPYPLTVTVRPGADPADPDTWRVQKMKWAKRKDPISGKNIDDRTTLIYNTHVTISGIPEAAETYLLGSRSALAWLLDRYQLKTDKDSTITNDPGNWQADTPKYLVDLIAKVTTVSVETMRIVDGLAE